ncbi:ABC transporter permease [Actinokineospora fastidiosa]|uniref:ABC transporter permease n=1 Tax=Actinokineospora fastidiosa TaxID=1816 RepID=A0A918L7B4_9PSEU|nr:ABC transporter permease [Actinokineospora fastidiosa]GGS15457.1 ABC transporter permease [Actinokineospora fastidiosa]
MGPASTVWLIARREIDARLRTRSFVVSTVAAIVALVGLVLMQSTLFSSVERSRVGLAGQAAAIATPLVAQAGARGIDVDTTTVPDVPTGEAMVGAGELDVLVSGAPAALRVVVREALDNDIRQVLTSLVREQVLRAELAAVEDLDPDRVLTTVADATIDVHTMTTPDPARDQRMAVALIVIALLYMALLFYGTMVAQGVVEEKASRVVEVLLATVRPWQLLMGKVIGLGLVGLAQFAAIGGAGLLLALTTGVLAIPSAAIGTLAWGLVWYLLGFLFYATVFAAAGSLVSRQEETSAVLLPITMVLVVAFVLGFGLLSRSPSGTATTVLSLVPPLSPVMMPGRIALGVAPLWQIGLAMIMTLAAVAGLAWLGARVYTRAALSTGPRMRLRDAMRVQR